MRKHLALLGLLLTFTTANSASARIVSGSNPLQRVLAIQALEKAAVLEKQELQPLIKLLEAEVRSELVQEALQELGEAKLRVRGGFETYLSEDKPFDIMLAELESLKINEMDRADLLITVIKAGLRYQYLANVRFDWTTGMGEKFLANEAKLNRMIQQFKSKLGLPQ